MGGRIGVESAVGSGSRFWFRVPLPIAEDSGKREVLPLDPDGEDSCPEPLKALVVEDIETNRMVAKRMLQDHGCHVALAVGGEDGVGQAEQDRFNVILMDISMPGIDGVEATRRIGGSLASRSRHAPIFALTAHALPQEHETFLEAGMQGCLVKPIRSQKIKELVARFDA